MCVCVCELSEEYLTVDLCLRTLQDNPCGPTVLVPSQNDFSHLERENGAKQENKPEILSQACSFFFFFKVSY